MRLARSLYILPCPERIQNFSDRVRVLHQRADVCLCSLGMDFGVAGHIFSGFACPYPICRSVPFRLIMFLDSPNLNSLFCSVILIKYRRRFWNSSGRFFDSIDESDSNPLAGDTLILDNVEIVFSNSLHQQISRFLISKIFKLMDCACLDLAPFSRL